MNAKTKVENLPIWKDTLLRNLPGEIWKPISKQPNYFVSNMGRVKSTKNNGQKILKQQDRRYNGCGNLLGYTIIVLSQNGITKTQYVHRLVAQTFIGDIPKNHHVDHINKDVKDNRVSNLRIITAKENTSLPGEKNPKAKLSQKDVEIIRSLEGILTGAEIGRMFDVNRNTIYFIFQNRTWVKQYEVT